MSDLRRVLEPIERYALYLAVFSLPLQALLRVPGTSLTATKVAGAFLIMSFVPRRLLSGHVPFARNPLGGAIGFFAAASLLSLITSVDLLASYHAFLTLVGYAMVFYVVAAISADEAVQTRVPLVFVTAAALSGLGAVVALSGHAIQPTVDFTIATSGVRRVCVGLLDANEQALMFLFALALLLFGQSLWQGRRRRLVLGLATAAILAGLALTMSRTGWIGAVGLGVVRVLRGRRPIRAGLALIVAAALVLAVGLAVKPVLVDSMKRRAMQGINGGDTSLASRVAHYVLVVDAAGERGALGHGLATTDQVSAKFRDPLDNRIGATVHNVPFIIWLELGWVGLIAFGWLWSTLIALLYTAYRSAPDGLLRERFATYSAIVATYGFVSLVMPFVYRSAFPILLGCTVGAVLLGYPEMARGSAPLPDSQFRAR